MNERQLLSYIANKTLNSAITSYRKDQLELTENS